MSYGGADTARLRQLANEAEQILATVREAKSTIQSLQTELPTVWVGNDSQRFVGELGSTHLPAVQRAESRLVNAIAAMRTNAQRQDDVSSRLT